MKRLIELCIALLAIGVLLLILGLPSVAVILVVGTLAGIYLSILFKRQIRKLRKRLVYSVLRGVR